MSWLTKLFSDAKAIFDSPKLEKVEQELTTLVGDAMPIVEVINATAPNKTLAEVEAAYQKFGVPLTQTIDAGDQTAINNALLNLASTVLQKNHLGTVASVLNTAVQLAVVAANNGVAAAK